MSAVFAAVLALAGLAAFALNDPVDWRPWSLFGLLLTLAIGSDAFAIEVRGLRVSGSFLALVLGMALLGPAPAVALGTASSLIDGLVGRRPLVRILGNTSAFAVFPLAGASAMQFLLGPDPTNAGGFTFATVVFVVFLGAML